MAQSMRYRLALDLGSTSLGWAMIRPDAADAPCAVIKAGVRIFSNGRHAENGPQKGASLAVNNAMRLVDDLMEPFRPMIDLKVWQLKRNGENEVSPETKRALVRTLYDDMQTDAGATPVIVCAQKLCTSLAQVYLGERDKLDLPLPGLPLALAAALGDV